MHKTPCTGNSGNCGIEIGRTVEKKTDFLPAKEVETEHAILSRKNHERLDENLAGTKCYGETEPNETR